MASRLLVGLVRGVEGGEVSSKRQYWSKMNHDEARHAIELMNDAEAGRWLRGWLAGAGGNDAADDVLQSKPIEWRTGYTAGKASHEDAKEYSQKQSDRVAKRYTKATTVASGSDPVAENATADLPSGTNNNTTNNEQRKETKRARQAAFSPPTIEQVREHAQKIGVTDPDKFHSYHASRGWVVGKAPMKSWQHAMQTWLGNQAAFSRQSGFTPAQPPRPAAPFDPARRTPMFETRPAT